MNLNINMELNGDQKAFVNSTKQFADEYIVNNALEWDKKQIFPRNVFKKSAELGLAGIYVDQEDGGSGLKRLDAALIFEELAYACPSTSAFLSIHNMTAWMLSKYGCEQVKEKYMKNIITMQNICSYCLTEPGSGSDAAAMRTKGNPDSNNTSLNINGSKSFISGAGESDLYFVMMKTDIKSQDETSCVIIEKNNKGISFGKNEEKMGWKNQPTRVVSLDQCIVPFENIVGKPGEGFQIAMQGLDGGRVNIAACSLGAARYCIDKSIHYVNERKQFGSFLKEFQSIQFKIADMITDYNAARLMVHEAAKALDDNKNNTTIKSAMAKKFATDVSFKICNEALQIHGGYGYLSEYGIEKMVRDTRVHQILEGTNEVMKLIISRNNLKV